MNIFKEIRWFIQRGRRGWADCDVWSLDSYLIEIIVPALKKLKENKIGCPSELWDEKTKNNECHRWQEILEEMIQGFEACQEMDKPPWIKGNFKKEIDTEKLKILEKKYRRGMELFGRYFRNLWD